MKDLTADAIMLYLTGNASPEVTRTCDELRKDPNSVISRLIDELRQKSAAMEIDWRRLLEDSDAIHLG